ncbi:hypothetical protein EJ04DRAFT_520908 [Polyplosphaeria fusca]|uniref:Nudix hydrolase domain-containing protein n=1 Tax=Polyplosphaeria fusca TaxID=682080 RepID=A0A9P4R6E6_9PLEO|nr:hypothetical protein EJ04DRAFT_520908 [Polyplosphaeria fusca]
MPPPEYPTPKTVGSAKPNISYTRCHAIRVVAFNAAGDIALIFAKRDNYYKLPGGGIDPGEDHDVAAQREMLEETGAKIKLRAEGGCVATTEEYRGDLHQRSCCYCADLVDGAGEPSLTEDEVKDGLRHLWVPVEEAKRRMATTEPTSELGWYIKERDGYLLHEATK